MPRVVVVVVLVSLLPLLSPVGAIGPLQDDAGTGGDASDVSVAPTRIGPGTYRGVLDAPVDRVDDYGVALEAGDRLDIEFEVDAPYLVRLVVIAPLGATPFSGALDEATYMYSLGGSSVLLAPFSGTWLLRVEAFFHESVGAADYRLGLVVGPDQADVVVLESGGLAYEASAGAGMIQTHVSGRLPGGEPAVLSSQVAVVYGAAGERLQAVFGTDLLRHGGGDVLLGMDIPRRSDTVLQQAHLGDLHGSITDTVGAASEVRGHGYGSGTEVWSSLAVERSRDVVWGPVGAVTAVTFADFSSGSSIQTPVANEIGNASLPVMVHAGFHGTFWSWGAEAHAVDPAGAVHNEFSFFGDQAGEWTLVVDDHSGLYPAADDLLLWGVDVPRWTVFPDVPLGLGFGFGIIFLNHWPW